MPQGPAKTDRKRPANVTRATRATRVTRAGTVALVGRPNVGKSTLLNALLGERIAITSPHPQTTRDRIAGILTTDGVQYVFLDTPGLHRARHRLGERMNDLARDAAAGCDVAVFVTDASPGRTVHEADAQTLEAIPSRTPTVLVLNKVDKIRPRSNLFPILEAYAKLRDFAAIVPTCALRGSGADRVLDEIAERLPAGGLLYPEDELTDKPVRFFVAELVREQILERTREEVPHGVAVTVESFEEATKIVRIAVTVHVAKESHKAIVIGDGGKMLAAIGAAARRRAAELLGRKVHLETWVRATPKWFDSPAVLRELGYAEEGGGGRSRRARRGGRS